MTNNNKQNKTNMKKTLNVVRYALVSLFSFLFIGSALADAPTPVAVWNGNFLSESGGIVPKTNNNTVNNGGASITIAGNNNSGLEIDLAEDNSFGKTVSVLFKYSTLNSDGSNRVLASIKQDACDNIGIRAKNSTLAGYYAIDGSNRGNDYGNITTTIPTSGYCLLTYSTANQNGVYGYVASVDNQGVWTWSDRFGNSQLKYTGDRYIHSVFIGGPYSQHGYCCGFTGLTIEAVAVFNTQITTADAAAYKFPEPTTVVFSNINCGADSSGGVGDYNPATLTIPTSCGLPEGTELKIKSITFAQEAGKAWNYSADYIILGGVQSDLRNGGSQTLTAWSIGNKLEYTFSKEIIVKVGTEYAMTAVLGGAITTKPSYPLRIRLFKTTAEEHGYIKLHAGMDTWRPAYQIVAEKVEPDPFIEPEGTTDENDIAPSFWYRFNGNLTSSGARGFNTFNPGSTYTSDRAGQEGKALIVANGQTVNESGASPNSSLSGDGSQRTAFTISIIAKIAENGQNKVVLSEFSKKGNGDDIILAADPINKKILVCRDATILIERSIDDITTAFHTYVVTGDGSKVTLYVDGVANSTTSTTYPNTTRTACGIFRDGGGGYQTGFAAATGSAIDDYRVYCKKCLTAEQVAKVGKNMYNPITEAEMEDDEITVSAINALPALADVGPNDTVKLTLIGSEAKTLYFDDEFKGGSIKVVYDGAVKLNADAAPIDFAKYDFTEVTSLDYGWLAVGSGIAINFNQAQGKINAGADSNIPDLPLKGACWNNTDGKDGSVDAVIFAPGGETLVAGTTAKVSWSSATTYQGTGASGFLNGYIDDGNPSPTIRIDANVPFDRYDVLIFAATDMGDCKFRPFKVNGEWYTWSDSEGKTVIGSQSQDWGVSRQTAPIYGKNTLRVINQTSSALTIEGLPRNGYTSRGCIAAIVIVKVDPPTPAATATVDASVGGLYWGQISWDGGIAPSEDLPAEITVTGNGELVIMQSDETDAITANGITFKGAGSAKLMLADSVLDYNGGTITAKSPFTLSCSSSAVAVDSTSDLTYDYTYGLTEIEPAITCSGALTLKGAKLNAQSSVAPSSVTFADNATLTMDVSSATTINGITGAGTFIKTGTAELTLNNKSANDYAIDGTTVKVDAGAIMLNNGNGGDPKVKDATFILVSNANNNRPVYQNGWCNLFGTITFENEENREFLNSTIRTMDGLNFVKRGAGMLTLIANRNGNGSTIDGVQGVTVEAGKFHFNNNVMSPSILALDFSALDKTATPIDGDFTLAANTSYKLPSTLGENEAFTLCTGTLSGATSGRYVITVGEKTDDAELTFEGNTVRYAWLGSASATISEDTKLSDIIWEPAVTDPSMTKLMLTVANGAAIILDGTFDCASLDITGDAKFVADDSVYEDGCWEKVLFNSPITISGSISFGELKEGFYGAFTQAANSISLRAQNKEVISINIAGGSSGGTAGADSPSENLVTGDGFYGIAPTLGDSWNNINKQWTDGGKTIEIVGPNAYDGANVIERPTMSLSATGKNTWQCGSIANPFLRGYLDDGNGVTVEVHGVPYTEYDVIVYATSDDASIALAPVTINGTQYTFKNGETTPGSDVWGVGQYATPEIGKNALRVNGCTGDTVTINAARIRSPRDGRATLCAVQVINKGDVVIKQDFSATISASTKFSEINWNEGEFVEGQLNDVTIAVADGEGEVEIEFDKPDMMLGKITITCARPIKFKATAALPNVGQFIVDDCTSYITYAWPATELKTAANGVTYAGGAGTADAAAPITFAVNNGSMTLKDATFYIGTTDSGTQSTVNMENATVYANGDAGFGIGQASFNLSGTTKLTSEKVVLSQGAPGRTSNLTLSDSAEIVVTGSTIADSNTSSIMFGHWNGPSTFTMGDNAKFTAPNAQVLVGKTGNNQTININGGVFTAKGIKASASASGTNALNLNGGELKLGEYGITSYNAARTIPVTVAGDAKITSTAAMPITQVITVNEGKTLTLDATAGAITMSGQVVNNGTIELKSGTINLGAKREFGAFKTDAGTTLAFTSSLAEDGKFSFKLAEGSVLPTVMLDGVTIENPTFENNTIIFTYTPSVSGAACYYDWTFTNTVQTTGAKTIATSAYSKNQASLEGDLNTSYADQNEEGLYTSLYTSVRPWANLNWSSVGRPWTIALAGKMSEYPNTVFISLGGANKTFFFSTTDTPNEVRLVYGTNQNHCEEITVMSVPAASTLVHVYEITLSADGKDLTVYLDGLEWASSHKEEGFEMINGIQVSGWYGGNYFSSGYKRDGDSGQTDTDKVGRIKMLRVYNSILGPNAMAKLSEEFPYNPQYGAYSRTLDEEAETWSATEAWTDDEGQQADIPVNGSVANLTVGVNSELTINATEEIHQESITIVGQNNEGQTLSIKAGTGEIINDGATIITTPVTIEYGAMTIAGGPTKINGNGSVTFDFSEYPIETVFSQGRLGLTGLCDAPEGDDKSTWPVKLIVPEDLKGRKMTLEYTDNNKYELIYGIARTESTTLYLTTSGEIADNTLFATSAGGQADTLRLYAEDIVVIPSGVVATVPETGLHFPLTHLQGEGTVVCDGYLPTANTAIPETALQAPEWKGTTWLKNISETPTRGFKFPTYKSENSKIRLTNVKGWLTTDGQAYEGAYLYNQCPVELVDGDNGEIALEVTNSAGKWHYHFEKLSGSGTLKFATVEDSAEKNTVLVVTDVSDFTGKLLSTAGLHEDGVTVTAARPIHVGNLPGTIGNTSLITIEDGVTLNANCGWQAAEVAFGATLIVKGAEGDTIVSGVTTAPALNTSVTLKDAQGETVAGEYVLKYDSEEQGVKIARVVTFTVPAIAGATPTIEGCTIGEDGSVTVPYGESVTLVYTADNGKLFNDGEDTLSVQLDNITDATTIATTIATAIEGKSTVDAVAKIGTTLYLTLADAVTAAGEGAQIDLLVNVTIGGITIPSGKNFVLEFNSKSITFECPGAGSEGTKTIGFQILEGSTIVFQNGTIQCSEANASKTWEKDSTEKGIAMIIQNYADLTLDGMQVNGTYIAHNGVLSRYVLSINSGNVKISDSWIYATGNDFAFDTCDDDKYAGIPTVIVDGEGIDGSVIVGKVELSGGDLNLVHGSIDGELVATAIGDGVITKTNAFNVDAPEGYLWKDGVLTKATVKIDSTYYSTLAEAITAVQSGETIELLADMTIGGITIPSGKNFTLEFHEKTITFEHPGAGSEGTQTIGFQILEGSTIIFQNGTIQCSKENKSATWQKDSAEKGIAMVIQNYADLTLKNMQIDGTNIAHNGVPTRYVLSINSGAVSIYDTTITAAEGDFAFDTCDDDKYDGVPAVTVDGSTYYGSSIEGNVELSGGNLKLVKGSIDGELVDGGIGEGVIIKGAAFDVAAPNGWVWNDEGYLIEATAKIGSIFYLTLADAVKAAVDGNTVELLESCTGDGIKIDKSITIDFGGFVYTVDASLVGSPSTQSQAFNLVKDKTITLKNGTIESKVARMLVQNYANLTLEDMILDGSELAAVDGNSKNYVAYTLSNCDGDTVITGITTIVARSLAGQTSFAFDTYYKAGTYEDATVTIDDEDVNIMGNIELAGGSLTLNAGTLEGELVAGANIEKGVVTKAATFEAAAPAGYIWDDNGKLVAKALPTATQDTMITVEGCDLAVKYTLGTAAVGYDDWNVDFEISSDVALAAEEFTLKGSNPLDGEPMVDFPPFALEADTPVKLLETFAPQFQISYAQLIELTGGSYTCAVVNKTEKQATVTVKIILSNEGEDDIVVEGSTFKGTLAKDYGIVISDDGKDLAITGKGSADVVPAFTIKQKLSVKEAVIRDGVEIVGKRFFKDFTKLNKVTVGKDVTTIGEKAFYKCMSLEKIVIENPDFDLTQLTDAVVYQLMLDDKGVPYVYPSIEVPGYTEMLEGKVNLTDPKWEPIGEVGKVSMQETPYYFFRVVLTKESAQSQN